MKILGNRVLVEFDKPDTKVGSIYIPPRGKQAMWGTVIDVGEGVRLEDGTFVKPDIDVGDRAFCGPYTPKGDNYYEDGKLLVVMLGQYIEAKISKKDLK